MKLPNILATLALKLAKKAALKIVAKSVASDEVDLNLRDVEDAITQAAKDEVARAVRKRVGG